jgi:hypothetical protein
MVCLPHDEFETREFDVDVVASVLETESWTWII